MVLPTTDTARTYQDTQRTEFIKQTYEKEAELYGIKDGATGLKPEHKALLDTIRGIDAEPVTTVYPGTTRTQEQVDFSMQIHKRVNPGYVEMPYESSNTRDFGYKPPPDFTREYLKSDSDLHFAKFAAAALSHSVPLNKTSH